MQRSRRHAWTLRLTKRGEDAGEPIPMCGVPAHSAESYLARLIKGGHRVAIAEQTESPAEARRARGSKALVDRAIVRLVTPGTLTEETLLQSSAANWLAALGHAGEDWAIAAADISTGRFELIACDLDELSSQLGRLAPAEVIGECPLPSIRTRPGNGGFDSMIGERALKDRFGLRTLDGLGSPSRAELSAAGGLLAYLDATQKGAGILLDAPKRIARSSYMAIDAATRDSLELTRSVTGTATGSLLAEIDRCQTAPARRLLAEDISAPLTDRGAIESRLALVTWLHEDALRRERLRLTLRTMPDFARALARLAAGRGSPRDLALLRDGLAAAEALKCQLELEADRPHLLEHLIPQLGGHEALTEELSRALVAAPPIDASKGGISPRATIASSTRCAMPLQTAGAPLPYSRQSIATVPGCPRSRSGTTPCWVTI